MPLSCCNRNVPPWRLDSEVHGGIMHSSGSENGGLMATWGVQCLCEKRDPVLLEQVRRILSVEEQG